MEWNSHTGREDAALYPRREKILKLGIFFFKAGILNFKETLNSALQSGFYLALLKMFNIHKNIHVQKNVFVHPILVPLKV